MKLFSKYARAFFSGVFIVFAVSLVALLMVPQLAQCLDDRLCKDCCEADKYWSEIVEGYSVKRYECSCPPGYDNCSGTTNECRERRADKVYPEFYCGGWCYRYDD